MAIDFITYLRVSTSQQNESGLGLTAQRVACQAFTRSGNVIAEFVEVESGKRNDRPQLLAALDQCRQTGATLVVAKLDRLARNVAFVSKLMESNVEFLAADNANASRLTIHILAAVAENEAMLISQRTKAALAAAKARGVQLGNPNLTDNQRRKGSLRGGSTMAEKASRYHAAIVPMIQSLRAEGLTFTAIAATINEQGFRTQRGKLYSGEAIRRLFARI
jgi:DNA invertase Pin-like site-specific DNA recombinase